MTREEAKKEIIDMANTLQLIPNTPKGKAVSMALKALEREPCETQMIDKSNFSQKQYKADLQSAYDCGKASVKPCEDAISRQAAIRWVKTECNPYGKPTLDFESGKKVIEHLKRMSPVTPQPKTGHWEWVQYDGNPNIGNWHCSECRHIAVACVNKNDKGGVPIHKYCSNCGTKMEVKE